MKSTQLSYLLIPTLFLTACFHDTDDAANVSSNQAFLSAFTQMEQVSDKSLVILDQQTDNSSAFSMIESNLGVSGTASNTSTSSVSAHMKPSPTASVNKAQELSRTLINTIQSYLPASPNNSRQKVSAQVLEKIGTEETSISQADVDLFLNELFNSPTRTGNTVTYTLKESVICQDAINNECATLLNKFKLQLTIIGSDKGEISLIIDDITLMALDYAPNYLALEMFLQGIKQIEVITSELDSSTKLNLPAIFTGSFKSSIELLSETSVEIISSIPEAINIDGDFDGEPITLSIASTSKLVSIKADSITQSASLEFGLGALLAKFASESFTPPYTTSDYEVSLAALTGLFQLSNMNNDSIVATNVGIGDQPFTVDIDNQNAVTFELDNIDFNINGTNQALTLDSALNVKFDVLNVNGELGEDTFDLATDSTDTTLTGSLSVTAPANTVLVEVESNDFSTEIIKVESGGPLSISGTDYFQIDATVNAGQCMESGEDISVFGDATNVTDC